MIIDRLSTCNYIHLPKVVKFSNISVVMGHGCPDTHAIGSQ